MGGGGLDVQQLQRAPAFGKSLLLALLLPVNPGQAVVHIDALRVQLRDMLIITDGAVEIARVLIIKRGGEIGRGAGRPAATRVRQAVHP